MTRPIYCDEDVRIPVADGLRQRGREVHTVRQHDRPSDTDREQLAFAVENDWILSMFDDDFFSFVSEEGLDHCGIIHTDQAGRQAGRRIGDVVKAVDAYLGNLDPETIEGHYL